jgi:hypothetical protein
MKTLEEMAEEYLRYESESHYWAKQSFFAGYKAAQEQLADADKVMFCVYCNDMHRGDCAVGKGKNHPALAKSQWISVKDRLPEEDVAVLVYGQVLNDPPDVIGVRRRYNGDQDWKHTWESEDGFIYREDDVTHWMPLPEPPKEEE